VRSSCLPVVGTLIFCNLQFAESFASLNNKFVVNKRLDVNIDTENVGTVEELIKLGVSTMPTERSNGP
jgi:hypothetical protein